MDISGEQFNNGLEKQQKEICREVNSDYPWMLGLGIICFLLLLLKKYLKIINTLSVHNKGPFKQMTLRLLHRLLCNSGVDLPEVSDYWVSVHFYNETAEH